MVELDNGEQLEADAVILANSEGNLIQRLNDW